MHSLGEPDAQKTPLSTNFQHNDSVVVSAYARCRRVESAILTDLESPSHTEATRAPLNAQLVSIRLLGHLMDKGPGDAAASHISGSVVSAVDHDQLLRVGKSYLESFVRMFRKADAPTPESESSPEYSPIDHTPPSFATMQDMINAHLIPNPRNYQEAKWSALARDNFQCVVSGSFHLGALEVNRPLLREVCERSLDADITNCCYIIPESSSLTLNIFKSLGYPDISTDLVGSKIHSLKNVLTMTIYWQAMFDRLALWFEATDEPHRYKVCTSKPLFIALKRGPRFVTFASTTPELELPSPELLGLHAACCRVAHMSGAAGYLDMLDSLDDNGYDSVPPEKFAGVLSAKLYHIQGMMDLNTRD